MGHQYQIRLKPDGLWHRRLHDSDCTVCGLKIVGAYLSRDWQLDENLCPVCFTPRERDTGKMRRLEREVAEEVEAKQIVKEWGYDDDITDRHEIRFDDIDDPHDRES